jgi:hypothetical protein
VNVDTIFKCFQSKTNDVEKNDKFTLVIEKQGKLDYPYTLDSDETRVSLVDLKNVYLNNPNFNTTLPPIFVSKNIKGNSLEDVVHEQIAPFYKNLISSSIQENRVLKLRVILNGVRVLLATYPIHDNKYKVIGCTLLETPYINIPNYENVSQN